MLSGNLSGYIKWNGKSKLTEEENTIVEQLVKKAHDVHKPVRFWGAPDVANSWQQLINLKVDYINTDHIEELVVFFDQLHQPFYKN